MNMKKYFLPIIPILLFFTFSCNDDDNDSFDGGMTLIELNISSEADTLLIIGGNEEQLSVNGTYIEIYDNVIINKGGITKSEYTEVSADTTIQNMDESNLLWYSSDETVALVQNGRISTLVNGGLAEISTSLDTIFSNIIYLKVSEVTVNDDQEDNPSLPEPLLIIDPPTIQIVFESVGNISGWVAGSDFTLEINSNQIGYSNEGRFNESVTLDPEENIFNITATNNDEFALSQTRTKEIYFISFDEITGYWKGETLTRPFSFNIYKLLDQYLISGTLTIDLTLIGGELLVEDIAIVGLINADGTIDAELTKSEDSISVSGHLGGLFSTAGFANGDLTLTIEMLGVNKSHSEAWTAERQ